ncbi:MAG: malate dehydrogenase [Archaeoglobaceae archaeon]
MKIGFVGAGRIGSTSAFACLLRMDVDEIALVDVFEDVAVGEAMDLSHAAAALGICPRIEGGTDYTLLEGSDIVVVSAGMARKPGMTRLDLAVKNAGIIRDIAENLRDVDTNILVVSNPMDLMTYIMWKESGKTRKQVFGMGNLLDTSRLKDQLTGGSVSSECETYIIGEHGDSMFPAESLARVSTDFEDLLERTRSVAAEVIKRKGATFYGPAVCIYRMVKAVGEDIKEEIPTSVILQGEYGIDDVAIGVPAILGKNGVEKVVEYDLTDKEMDSLKNSARIIKQKLTDAGY